MIKKIAKFGPTYDPPSYNTLTTKGVERSKARMEEMIKPIRDSWEVTSCTLVSDCWIDRQSRPLCEYPYLLSLRSYSFVHH